MKYSIWACCIFLLFSCKSEPKVPALDLMKYGLPISINAPEASVVEADDMGIMKDVTVKSGDDYFIQIYSSVATSMDATKILADKKIEVEAGPFFTKIISEETNGFIYEKQITETTIDHDFIYVKIQGDTEYVFQTGLFGTFSLEQVQKMYDSVK